VGWPCCRAQTSPWRQAFQSSVAAGNAVKQQHATSWLQGSGLHLRFPTMSTSVIVLSCRHRLEYKVCYLLDLFWTCRRSFL
jgi:hypothetical protein